MTPYQYAESVACPPELTSVTVHHAEGADEDEAIGFSKKLSFDEAFANAVADLPLSGIADGIDRVTVREIGGLFGGFFPRREMFVRIRRIETT